MISVKRTILHIITTLDPGGAEHHLLSLLPAMKKNGYAITLAYLKGTGSLADQFRAKGIEVINFRMSGLLDLLFLWKILRLVRKKRFDIVHTHLFKADIYGAFGAKLGGCSRIISTKHNEDQYLQNPFFAFLARRAADLNSRTVMISEACARFMREVAGLPPEKIRTIHYGIDIPADGGTRNSRDRIRAQFGVSDSIPLLVTVGRLSHQKGHRYLLEAMQTIVQECPSSRLLIVGEGPLRHELQTLSARLALNTHVLFSGFQGAVKGIFEAADIFVFPSLWEGFGLVLLEAMVAGLPVVASSTGAIPEVVVHGVTGLLVPPANPQLLANAIVMLLRDPEKANGMGIEGRRRAEAEFNLDKMVNQWIDLYGQVLVSP